MSASRAARILLLGYYGFGNAGDEAVLAGLVRSLQAQSRVAGKPLDIAALSIAPESTARDHGIRAFHRYRLTELLDALRWCDLLAAGGGSLLQDVTSSHSIYYYLGIVRLAQLMGKRTVFIAQGIGPLNLSRSRRLTAAVAKRCDALIVRDPGSAQLLQEIGVDHPPVAVAADPALLLGMGVPVHKSKEATLLISLRPWPASPTLAEDLCAALAQLPERALRFKPLACAQEDEAALREIAVFAEFHGEDIHALTYNEILMEMPDCGLLIGMRLHALILASACGVPCVALSYDPKVKAFMEQSGQGESVYDVRAGDPDALAQTIERAWTGRETTGARLADRLPQLQADAMRSAQIALHTLGM